MGRIIAKLGVFGGRCDFKGHKGWYLRPAGGLPDPRGLYWGTSCGGHSNGGLTHNICIASRIRGTCLRVKRRYGHWLTWYTFVRYDDVRTSQSRWCRHTVKCIRFTASNIREFECSHQWGDGPGIFLRMGMVMEVQFSIVRMALNVLPTGSMEDLSIT